MNRHRLLLVLSLLGISLAALLYWTRPTSPPLGNARPPAKEPASRPGASSAPSPSQPVANPAMPSRQATGPAASPSQTSGVSPVYTAGRRSGPLVRTPEGRIDPARLADFEPIAYPGGEPAFEGEKVTAYVAVPSSGRKVALTVNQLGEFPRIQANESEQVEILLVFTDTQPGTRVALAAQDGGRLHTGKLSGALPVDGAHQLAFAFTISPNPGMHRVSLTTQTGELKTLEFWAGPPSVLMSASR